MGIDDIDLTPLARAGYEAILKVVAEGFDPATARKGRTSNDGRADQAGD